MDPTKNEKFPHTPIIKIANFRHDVTKVDDFYNWGLWGNYSFLSDPTEIRFLTILKTLTNIMKVSVRKNK